VFGIGMTELMVIFVIGLVVLGPKRLPSLARSLGKSLAEFRRASTALRSDFMDVADELRVDPLDAGKRAKPDTPEDAAQRNAAKAAIAQADSDAASDSDATRDSESETPTPPEPDGAAEKTEGAAGAPNTRPTTGSAGG